MENNKDLKIKLGSDDMVFWTKTIRETEFNLKNSKNDIKLYEILLKAAKEQLKKAEEEFNSVAKKPKDFS